MSLIEEALRRIQQPLPAEQNQRTAAAPSEPSRTAHSWSAAPLPPSPRSSSPPRPLHLPLLLVAASTIGLTAVLMISGAFWLGHTVRTGSSASPRMTVSPQPLPVLPPPAAESSSSSGVKRQQPPSDQLILSGIVEGLGDPYAVINGLILGVGEHIDGSTLLSIGNGMVKVRRVDGSEEILRVQR